jgi:DNA-binding transcriptional LysR family regulator
MCNFSDLLRSQLVAVMPKNHRLARNHVVKPGDLVDEALIGLPEFSASQYLSTMANSSIEIQLLPVCIDEQLISANAEFSCSFTGREVG